jgi:hypothetical protein
MAKSKGYKVKFVKKLTDKGFPTHAKNYKEAHAQADNAERKANPKMYKEAAKAEKTLGKNELMGKNFKNTKIIEIEKKFKKLSPTIIRHETTENKALKRKMKKKN